MKKIVMMLVVCLGVADLVVVAAPREGHDRDTVFCRRRFRRSECSPCVGDRAFPIVRGDRLDHGDTREEICLLKLEVCRLSRKLHVFESLICRLLERDKGMRLAIRGGDRERDGDGFDLLDEEIFDRGDREHLRGGDGDEFGRGRGGDSDEFDDSALSSSEDSDDNGSRRDHESLHDREVWVDMSDSSESATTEIFDYELDVEDFDTIFE